MHVLGGIVALVLVVGVLWDAFETIVLPRRVVRPVRLTRTFYRATWTVWLWLARPMRGGGEADASSPRETFLAFYGPLALIFLLTVWAGALIVGFGTLQWALGSHVATSHGPAGFGKDLYMSGTNFFTIGLGDVTPTSARAEALTVIEGGTGFGFLALVIGYLPILYQAFSRREVDISLLDARAGSPPSAVELLRRNCKLRGSDALAEFLRDWEGWAAQLLESHLSYPSLAYFRSQHENQSWLGALTAVLDVCALVMLGIDEIPTRQAELTFAIARHASVDLSQIFNEPPRDPEPDRLPPDRLVELRAMLAASGLRLPEGPQADARLHGLRALYEPYVGALSWHLKMELPAWLPPPDAADDWQTTAWDGTELPRLH